MTDDQVIEIYEKMKKMFGDVRIPNPEHEPISFAYAYKLYKYYESQKT